MILRFGISQSAFYQPQWFLRNVTFVFGEGFPYVRVIER